MEKVCAVEVIIAQIITRAHPAPEQTLVYEHVRPLLLGIIMLAKIQITTLHKSIHLLIIF